MTPVDRAEVMAKTLFVIELGGQHQPAEQQQQHHERRPHRKAGNRAITPRHPVHAAVENPREPVAAAVIARALIVVGVIFALALGA